MGMSGCVEWGGGECEAAGQSGLESARMTPRARVTPNLGFHVIYNLFSRNDCQGVTDSTWS